MTEDEIAAAVLGEGGFIVARINRFIFAVANGADAGGVDAGFGQGFA